MPATSDAAKISDVKLLVAGKWTASSADRWGEVFNPSTGQVIARVPFCDEAEVATAIEAAADALPDWKETPVVERARVMFRFREKLQDRFEELAALVTREHGKTISEARAEVQRGIEMVEFACGIPSLIMGQSLENIATNVDAETSRHPVGVCAGIMPFNFPFMVPLWMFPVAITCGNTFVLKPSEKVPLSSIRMGELLIGGRFAAGRVQYRAWRQAVRRCTADASAGAGDFVRRQHRRGEARLRNRNCARQTRAGGWRREEPSDHHARRRSGSCGERPCKRAHLAAPANDAWPAAWRCRWERLPTTWSKDL